MTDILKWENNAMEQMEYISIVESILLPDYENYEYPYEVSFVSVTEEEKEDLDKSFVPLTATICIQIFYERYNDNKIVPKSWYEKYISNTLIQGFIRDLELDVYKFWLLILFIYDYCENLFFQGETKKQTPPEQMTKLCEIINKTDEIPMTLTFTAGKQKFVIESSYVIKAIADLITNLNINELSEDSIKKLNTRETDEKTVVIKESPYIAFFARILLRFFDTQQQVRSKRKKGANHSTKEIDLVCQVIYFLKISMNNNWQTTENEMLKAYLKQYKNYKYPNNINSVYPAFSV